MPGFPQELLEGVDSQGNNRIKKFMCIMDSMTEEGNVPLTIELDNDGKLFNKQPSRIQRVSKGAGAHPIEVEEILTQCKRFAQMVKKMGGTKGILKGLGGADMRNANPNQMAKLSQHMSKMIDPNVIKSMGGMGGLQNMMRQMATAEGLFGSKNSKKK